MSGRMDKLKGWLGRAAKADWLPFAALWAVFTLAHLMFRLGTGDDVHYAQILAQENLFAYLSRAYLHWSSRTLVDVFVCVMNYLPGLLWRLVNPLMVVLCAHSLAVILNIRRDAGWCWFLCACLLLYPWQLMSSAGWITTSTVFLWPAALALFALSVAARAQRGEPVRRVWTGLAVLAMLYAVTMEQVAALVFLLLAGGVVFLLAAKRRPRPLPLVLLAEAVAGLVWFLASPGVKERFEGEQTSWFPNFGMKSVFSKLELGLSAALSELVYSTEFVFFLLCLLTAWLVWTRYRSPLYRALSLPPLAAALFFGVLKAPAAALWPGLAALTGAVSGEGVITLANVNAPTAFIPLVLLYGIFILSLVNLYIALGHTTGSLACVYAVGCGLGSQAVMGFSPTIWVSGQRAGFFFWLVVLGVCAHLFGQACKNKGWMRVVCAVLFCAMCAVKLYALFEMRIATGYG